MCRLPDSVTYVSHHDCVFLCSRVSGVLCSQLTKDKLHRQENLSEKSQQHHFCIKTYQKNLPSYICTLKGDSRYCGLPSNLIVFCASPPCLLSKCHLKVILCLLLFTVTEAERLSYLTVLWPSPWPCPGPWPWVGSWAGQNRQTPKSAIFSTSCSVCVFSVGGPWGTRKKLVSFKNSGRASSVPVFHCQWFSIKRMVYRSVWNLKVHCPGLCEAVSNLGMGEILVVLCSAKLFFLMNICSTFLTKKTLVILVSEVFSSSV